MYYYYYHHDQQKRNYHPVDLADIVLRAHAACCATHCDVNVGGVRKTEPLPLTDEVTEAPRGKGCRDARFVLFCCDTLVKLLF